MNFVQMECNLNVKIFWLVNDKGECSVLVIFYVIGLVQGVLQSENGKKLINFLLSKEVQICVSEFFWGMLVCSDVMLSDEYYKVVIVVLEGVQSWQLNWDDVVVLLLVDISCWYKVIESE